LDLSVDNKPFSYAEKRGDRGERKKFKVGDIKESTDHVQPEVKKNFEESLKVLRRFADVEVVAFPDMPFGEVVSTIVKAEGASALRDLLESGKASQLRATNDRWGGYAASMVLAVDYLQAMRLRGPVKMRMDQLY